MNTFDGWVFGRAHRIYMKNYPSDKLYCLHCIQLRLLVDSKDVRAKDTVRIHLLHCQLISAVWRKIDFKLTAKQHIFHFIHQPHRLSVQLQCWTKMVRKNGWDWFTTSYWCIWYDETTTYTYIIGLSAFTRSSSIWKTNWKCITAISNERCTFDGEWCEWMCDIL